MPTADTMTQLAAAVTSAAAGCAADATFGLGAPSSAAARSATTGARRKVVPRRSLREVLALALPIGGNHGSQAGTVQGLVANQGGQQLRSTGGPQIPSLLSQADERPQAVIHVSRPLHACLAPVAAHSTTTFPDLQAALGPSVRMVLESFI
jgi:hypothetical protein